MFRRFAESQPSFQREVVDGVGPELDEKTIMKMLSRMDPEDKVVDKALFDTWIQRADVTALFEEVEVDTSTKFDLFDALDVDGREELTLNTIVEGLMKLRGPISKLDVVSTRLKVAHIMRMVMDICRKLGISIDEYSSRSSEIFGMM